MTDSPDAAAYVLGVDLGTTFSAAAVGRPAANARNGVGGGPPGEGHVEVVSLGSHAQVIPSVIALREDGGVLAGEAADLRSLAEPDRSARQFKRRVGDEVPLVLGGVPYGAETLTGYLLHAVVTEVSEREGDPPALVVLTHPANWSAFKLSMLEEAAKVAGLSSVQLLSEPEAAAIAYASRERIADGEVLAVYDLGGGTFDVALLRRKDRAGLTGFEAVGRPEGLERLGGIDFDEAVRVHVDRALDGAVTAAAENHTAYRALARLRADCTDAKEHLSSNADVPIPVMLPDAQTEVRLTRDEFEAMIRPRIAETVELLLRTVADAGLRAEDVSRILLVGGSSQIPLIADMIAEGTGRPTALDAHPKLTIATGAATWGLAHLDASAQPQTVAAPAVTAAAVVPETDAAPGPARTSDGAESGAPTDEATSEQAAPAAPPSGPERFCTSCGAPLSPGAAACSACGWLVGAQSDLTPAADAEASPRRSPTGLILAGIAAVVVVVAAILVIALAGHSSHSAASSTSTTSTTAPASTTSTAVASTTTTNAASSSVLLKYVNPAWRSSCSVPSPIGSGLTAELRCQDDATQTLVYYYQFSTNQLMYTWFDLGSQTPSGQLAPTGNCSTWGQRTTFSANGAPVGWFACPNTAQATIMWYVQTNRVGVDAKNTNWTPAEATSWFSSSAVANTVNPS
jgi:actin-like ATPase involved in cell morphogenesis